MLTPTIFRIPRARTTLVFLAGAAFHSIAVTLFSVASVADLFYSSTSSAAGHNSDDFAFRPPNDESGIETSSVSSNRLIIDATMPSRERRQRRLPKEEFSRAVSSTTSSYVSSPLSVKSSSATIDDHFFEEFPSPSIPLVVVGSDGSGTRSVVELLQRLGMPMAVDDAGTNDIHASEIGGWPPMVEAVLRETHSADYDPPTSLSATVHKLAAQDLKKLLSIVPRKVTSARGRSMNQRKNIATESASLVSWGFKAPVALLLIPLVQEILGPISVVHVIRDGRDVAFSNNQSPVQKFYNVSFPGYNCTFIASNKGNLVKMAYKLNRRRSSSSFSSHSSFVETSSCTNDDKWIHYTSMPFLRAMELWSNWNLSLRTWCLRAQQRRLIRYLPLRTEELVHANPMIRYKAISRVADFVGANNIPNDRLCCDVASRTTTRHTTAGAKKSQRVVRNKSNNYSNGESHSNNENTVTNRYGRWQQEAPLNSTKHLALQHVGGVALEVFGYAFNGSVLLDDDDADSEDEEKNEKNVAMDENDEKNNNDYLFSSASASASQQQRRRTLSFVCDAAALMRCSGGG